MWLNPGEFDLDLVDDLDLDFLLFLGIRNEDKSASAGSRFGSALASWKSFFLPLEDLDEGLEGGVVVRCRP